jgi:hypothetical protein
MSETAQHQTDGHDTSLTAVNALSTLNLTSLSFVQLRRLHKVLLQACADIEKETAVRADSDNSGDTVRVPSPRL